MRGDLRARARGRRGGARVTKVRGDADDVFSHGFLCPKGVVDQGAARRSRPRARAAGQAGRRRRSATATWDEAFAEIDRRLPPVVEAAAATRSAVYLGNPSAHTLAVPLYGKALLKALGHREHLLGQHRRPVPQAGWRRR